MDIDVAFPSKYLKAADLQGRNVQLVIDRVEIEEVGFGNQKDHKAVVYFKKTKKGLVLNVTNKNTIKNAYGKDTDEWTEKPLVLFTAMVDFAGETTEAIRVRTPKAAPTPKPAPQTQDELNPPEADLDDEIPF
jgi:hypothetical protein